MTFSRRLTMLAVALLIACGAALWLSPQMRATFLAALKPTDRHISNHARDSEHGHSAHKHGSGEAHREGEIKLSAEQIEKAKIELAPVDKGAVAHRISVTGTITPDYDRVARVAAKVVGTVAELRKRLGDRATKGEVLAILESREVADAKSDYLAALVKFDLQKILFERDQTLWDRRIISEQQYLRSQTTLTEAQIRLDVTRQKLAALDLSEAEVERLPKQPISALRQKEIRAPLTGQIVERRVSVGAPVGGEGHEQELYVIADLSSVWVELAVPTSELPLIREGQPISIGTSANDSPIDGKVIFISPLVHHDTRTARVIATVANPQMAFRPGTFVTAQVTTEEHEVELRIPRSALQTIGGEQVVFVRTEEGFEKREVVLGRSDDKYAEVVFGLDAGENLAMTNTFILKAEHGKSEADHGHAH
jgi:cobalt-zinc-cadmium efflux system membrane fusion protein